MTYTFVIVFIFTSSFYLTYAQRYKMVLNLFLILALFFLIRLSEIFFKICCLQWFDIFSSYLLWCKFLVSLFFYFFLFPSGFMDTLSKLILLNPHYNKDCRFLFFSSSFYKVLHYRLLTGLNYF